MLEVMGSKARTGRAQRGSMDRSSSSSLAKESERGLERDIFGRSRACKGAPGEERKETYVAEAMRRLMIWQKAGAMLDEGFRASAGTMQQERE